MIMDIIRSIINFFGFNDAIVDGMVTVLVVEKYSTSPDGSDLV